VAIAVDGSSPAIVGGSATSLQTATFSPPAGSVLVACVHTDPSRTITISNTVASLTWNTIFTSTTTTPGNTATAFYATLNSGATNMSVTAAGSVNNDFALKVYVITGADMSTPLGAVNSGGATPDAGKPLSKTLVPQVANSLGIICAEDFTLNDVGATSSSTTTWTGYDVFQNIAGGSGWRVMGAAGGTETFTVDVAGTQGAQWAWGVFEIRSAPVVGAVGNKILTHGTARPRAVIW
jgi:hypothetical protein